MTGSGVERTARTASRPVSVPFGGVSAHLLPTSQGVEGRPRRLAGRTGFRWGLRTLVIGGFAGAAWLLSGAAAHAAGPDAPVEPPSQGLSVVSLVNNLGTEAVERDPADRAATSTSARAKLAGQRTSSSSDATRTPAEVTLVTPLVGLTDRLNRLLPAHGTDQPSGGSGQADRGHPRSGDAVTAIPGVDGIARVLAAPFRLTDGPAGANGPLSPVTRTVTEPLRNVLRPVVGLLHTAASPVTDVLGPAVAQVPDALWSPLAAGPLAPVAVPATPGAATTLHAADPVGLKQAASGRSTFAQRFAAGDLPEAGTPIAASGVRPGPDRPEPTPRRGYLGAVSGIPAYGSGGPSESGPQATASSSFTGRTVAAHRMPATTGFAVRRSDAAAPTVSPD